MKITFLGTGTSTGIPLIGSSHPVCLSQNTKDKRLRSSVKIDFDNYTYIIDCGPDFRQQMINCNCKKIDGILFTHEHADHTAGLDDIRPFCFRNGALPIYGHKRVLDNLSNRFSYIFKKDNKYPGAPTVIPNHIEPNSHLNLNKFKVVPISHIYMQIFKFMDIDLKILHILNRFENN